MPFFPFEMKRAGITGEVVVRLTVDVDGSVRSASVVRSSQREFEAAALSASERWRFWEFLDPGVKERRGMIVDCRIKFALDDD